MFGGQDQETLIPSKARHENAQPDADRRPPSVAGQQIAAFDLVHFLGGVFVDHGDAFVILGKGGYG